MNITVILTGPGGELDRETFEANEDDLDNIDVKATSIIEGWTLAVGDTITIVEIDDEPDICLCGAPLTPNGNCEDDCVASRAADDEQQEDEPDDRCTNPGGHEWNRSMGEADEARLSGNYADDNIRCIHCGADGDA